MKDLHKGTTLIQASAGTGKTYRLCRIALQLTVQRGITLDRILAVTFTEAATEELAARIHELYQTALRELETGDIQEELLLACRESDGFDEEQAKAALRYSLEVFDEAPISTIHSFCKRSLDLVALETQTPLDAELSQVEDQLVKQLQKEYIRQEILERSMALSVAYGDQKKFEERLKEIGRQSASHPEASLKPTPIPVSIESLERRFSELPAALNELLSRKDHYLEHLAGRRNVTSQVSGAKPDLLACATRARLLPQDLKWLSDFRSEAWGKAMKKSGKDLPLPPFVSLVDRVLDQIEAAFTSLLYNYKPWLSKRLEEAKQQANSISFNDLLHLLNRALQGDAGEQVRTFLASRYDAALIDEFQDTDRTQLEIARALFGNGEHYLFYIGDPKQAIYRFRGADIYAYFKATRADGMRTEDLLKNYRSAPGLVHAVNTLFQESNAGFVDERIVFAPVESGVAADTAGSEGAPFRIEHCLPADPGFASGISRYREILAERAANDFAARILADEAFDPAEVAFLVNTKAEADILSDALLRRGISSAIRADRSVFQSKEAADLQQLLASLSSPTRLSLKRGVYAAFNRGISAEEIASPGFDELATPFYEYISEWAREWFSSNFDVCLQRLLQIGASRFPASLDSERRHANLCQLSELLSEARDEGELSPRGLYNWLGRKAEEDVTRNDDWQTRISSDEGKPQILTVHKSKGLQFPVVVLPFLGLRRVRLDTLAHTYHGADDELVIEYAPEVDSAGAEHSQRESLAEDVRLLYVALTRAERENVVYLCPEEVKSNKKTACSSFAQFMLDAGPEISSQALADCLRTIAGNSGGTIAYSQAKLEAGDPVELESVGREARREKVSARSLRNRSYLPFPERVLSFSALSKGLHREESTLAITELEAEETASDEGEFVPEPSEEASSTELSIFSLPKGTQAGDLLHLILERFDFSRPQTLAATTQQAFELLQFEPRDFEPIVAAQIAAIATAKLPGRFGTFSLQEVAPVDRVPELEFAYPVHGDVKRNVIAALRSAELGLIPEGWLARLDDSEAGLPASMMRGFIDLVLEQDGRLYIFDWKSNYLGPAPTDYGLDAILDSMADHHYFLQYLLYCVALKRFAKWRFPGVAFAELFGGVFYIYARGISPGKDTGIYYDLPAMELLDALDKALEGGDRR